MKKRLKEWERQVEVDSTETNTIAQAVAQAIRDHGDGDPNGLLAKIAVAVLRAKQRMLDEGRKERRRKRHEVPLDDVVPEPSFDPRRQAELVELCRVILERLVDTEAQVLELSFAAGMSRVEIAKAIGRSPRAVSDIRQRALEKARRMSGVSP